MSPTVRPPERTGLPDVGPSPLRYFVVLSAGALTALTTAVLMPMVGHGLRNGLCGGADTGCTDTRIGAAEATACRVISHADVVPDDAVLFTDDLGSSGGLTLSRTVDKNAVVHWFVRRDSTPAARGGEITEFPTEAAARAYITAAQHEPVRLRLQQADPTGLLARIAATVDGTALPGELVGRPQAWFVDAGSALDLGAQARSGVEGTIISGGVDGIVEVRTSTGSDPASTLFVELTEQAGEQFRFGTHGSQMTVVALTSDQVGGPRSLVVETAGRLRGVLRAQADTADDLMAGLLTEPAAAPEDSFVGRVTIRIDLRSGQNAQTAADTLHRLGVPLLLNQGTAGLDPGAQPQDMPTRSPVAQLYDLIDTGAPGTSVTISAYRPADGSDAATNPDGNDSPAVDLGSQGGLTVKGMLPGDDYYYLPGQGLLRWQTCG